MNVISSTAITICVCCIVCSVVNLLKPNGNTQKIFNLILGAFLLCSILLTVNTSAGDIGKTISNIARFEDLNTSGEDTYNEQVVKQTADNLVLTLNVLLENQNIFVKDIEIILNTDQEQGISIKEINIFIKEAQLVQKNEIINITEENFKITPNVIIAES